MCKHMFLCPSLGQRRVLISICFLGQNSGSCGVGGANSEFGVEVMEASWSSLMVN